MLGRVEGRVEGLVEGLEEGCEGLVLGRVDGLEGCDGRVEGLELGLVDFVDGLEAGFALDPVIGVRWLLELRDGLAEELRPPPPRLPPPPRASKMGIATIVVAMSHNNCLLQIFSKLSFILLL